MRKSLTSKQEAQLKHEIERMHERGSSDYQSLLRQVENKRKIIELNLPQLIASQVRQRQLYLEWGRGTGKTTILGYRLNSLLKEMPRSTGLFIGPTYQFILTRIVPSLVQGLEMFGLYENLHYFIGREPPRGWRNVWPRAHQPPKRHDKYITFFNGMGCHLISHDVPGDGRGINSDWQIGDEAALLAANKLQENTDPTLRGTNTSRYKDSYLFGSKMFTSTTPLAPEGAWFTQMEEQAMMYPVDIKFVKATCAHNQHNLRDGYLEDARRNAYSQWVYEAEYENKRPKFTKDSFYGLLDSDQHCYTNYDYDYYRKVGQATDCRGDGDLVRSQPLILGIDWGGSINCLTVSQYLRSVNEHRVLKSMYVLGSNQQIQDDLFAKFIAYYQHHENKEVELWYDNTGNVRTGHTRKTRAEQAQKQLSGAGWKVRLMTRGDTNPNHELKHMLWEALLREDSTQLPSFRMNHHNARELYLSMRNAKTKPGRQGEIKKDKSSERSKKIPRQEATDLSDAMDSVMFGRYYARLKYAGSALPGTRSMS